ncbi:MAG: hypothetical protein COX70_06135 [Flavobacteriales bacterium CG_4_10_14_0_2_um_filter_32_8]|nr:MAG: hypothetical protein COX70_06135 [Flavobacteriales bacterium CG_4_10_14_0_2_um_filter_32_8]PJB16116.1 MAG: hypothetical protein CO118_01055 [Flavobacteriales bacterium CG_4_9_14_3_um_filter_32_8]
MVKHFIFIALFVVVFIGCKPTQTINLPEQTVEVENPNKVPEPTVYHGSNTQTFDLIHTKLAVSFNWEKAYLYGKAELTLKPYFYPQSILMLDARGMDIHKVQLITKGNDGFPVMTDLKYVYDSLLITIDLPKKYTRNDTLKLFLDYTAKPNELKEGGSAAIRSDKGLYFINEKGEDQDKPQQIWTQGETEANSVWFPTIDSPNEKCTDEIAITVEEKYKTLSNGTLMQSEINGDGTRTDFWEMNIPHSTYLFMMAIGDFAVVKDKWRTMDVDYYVEHKYEPYAKEIFGLTPEMIEFFSTKLGVDYAWQKYSQIVVRDYVSGAMENTTATIHGEFVHQTHREMLDGNGAEDVISHELFHHWFGDLVTCESWANLPLNESFATYGEFLWREYKYGADKAAEGLQSDLIQYLQEVEKGKYKDMVRFDYKTNEDMFDRHTYQKGGRILHMLRNYIGDDAFFTSLKNYLNENKFTAVEMHQLRLSCEEVTGEDLNWFFNQWFFAAGHPILDINYFYNDTLKTQTVTVEQMQDFKNVPLYKLPLKIDIYLNGKVETKDVIVDGVKNIFSFDVASKPDLVNFDAEKMLLCEKVDNHKTMEEWVFMYDHAPRYLDRFEALIQLSKSSDEIAVKTLTHALNDKYSNIRLTAIKLIKKAAKSNGNEVKAKLIDLAKNDIDTKVRGDAMDALVENFDADEEIKGVLINAVSEESYYVIEKALENLSSVSYQDAMKFAKSLESDETPQIKNTVCYVYSEHGEAEQNSFFIKTSSELTGYEKYAFILSYNKYLKKQSNSTIIEGLPILKETALNENAWWMRLNGINAISDLESMFLNRINVAELELKDLAAGSDKELDLRNAINSDKEVQQKIEAILTAIKENEKNPRLRKMLGLKD